MHYFNENAVPDNGKLNSLLFESAHKTAYKMFLIKSIVLQALDTIYSPGLRVSIESVDPLVPNYSETCLIQP